MPNLYANQRYTSCANELWHTVKAEPPKTIYENQDYVLVFATEKGTIHPEAYNELHAPDILMRLESDRAYPELYSTEDKVAALHALERIQEGLSKKYETLADRIKAFVSTVINYLHTKEWVDDVTLEGRLYQKAIQDLNQEIAEDLRQAYQEWNKKEHECTDTIVSLSAAKRARATFKKTRSAAVKIQSLVRGRQARKVFQAMKAKAAEAKPVPAERVPTAAPLADAPAKKPESPLPVLTFSDEQIELEPRQFYVFDKNNPKEVCERQLRICGELEGKTGRCIRQLFRSFAKCVEVLSLRAVPETYHVYCLTLKQGVAGTVPGTSDKINLPPKVYFEIKGEGAQRVIHFINESVDLPAIAIDEDMVKARLGLFKKVEKPYLEVCAFLERITWKPV